MEKISNSLVSFMLLRPHFLLYCVCELFAARAEQYRTNERLESTLVTYLLLLSPFLISIVLVEVLFISVSFASALI